MKRYEIVWEIFNECARNQMRDVFIEEASIPDLEQFVRSRHKDRELNIEKTVDGDGDIIFDISSAGMHERYTFTEIESE